MPLVVLPFQHQMSWIAPDGDLIAIINNINMYITVVIVVVRA